jgi:hypothetical protein
MGTLGANSQVPLQIVATAETAGMSLSASSPDCNPSNVLGSTQLSIL